MGNSDHSTTYTYTASRVDWYRESYGIQSDALPTRGKGCAKGTVARGKGAVARA